MENLKKFICFYTIFTNGCTTYSRYKIFDSLKDGIDFCVKLDADIKSGICTGYEFRELDPDEISDYI